MRNLRVIMLLLVFPIFWGACNEEVTGGGEPAELSFCYIYVNTENGGAYQFENEEMIPSIYCYQSGSTNNSGNSFDINLDCDSSYFIEGIKIFRAKLGTVKDGMTLFEHPNGEKDTIYYHWRPDEGQQILDYTTRRVTHSFKGETISELDFNNDKSLIEDLYELNYEPEKP